nr:hypothetical protein GCM10020092_086320 [Actinoplanes digitatis]
MGAGDADLGAGDAGPDAGDVGLGAGGADPDAGDADGYVRGLGVRDGLVVAVAPDGLAGPRPCGVGGGVLVRPSVAGSVFGLMSWPRVGRDFKDQLQWVQGEAGKWPGA